MFQMVHVKMKCILEKGHWNDFLVSLAPGKDISCSACQACVRDFNMGTIKDELQDRESTLKKTQQACEPEPCLDLVVRDANAAPAAPTKRARAGRPKKGEEVQFNIFAFLEANRAGQYVPLDLKEAWRENKWKQKETICNNNKHYNSGVPR